MIVKNIVLSFAVMLVAASTFAQSYTPVDNGSGITFSIRNFGLTVNGSFKGLKGKVTFNPSNLSASFISVTVDAASINTENASRDKHLKKEEYFNAEKFTQLIFVSGKISNSSKAGILFLEGKITIKGVTKSVSFPFTATPKADGYLFEGTFKLNRRDFGVGGKSLVMSDNLSVSLSVFAKKN